MTPPESLQLLEALQLLLPAQFEALLFRLGTPVHYLRSSTAAQAERARELLQLYAQPGREVGEIARALEAVRGGAGAAAGGAGESNLPASLGAAFVGRAQERETLHQRLRAGAGGDPRIVTLWGEGGVGKTRLAIEYAWHHQDAYPGGIYHVTVQARQPIEVWAELGRLLFPRSGAAFSGDETAAEEALLQLGRQAAERRVLLVLDDVQGTSEEELLRFARPMRLGGGRLRPALPTRGAVSVLLTSRERDLGGVPSAERLDTLDDDEAVVLLCQRAGRTEEPLPAAERAAARELATQQLAGHALAISLAGGYLRKVTVGFAAYRDKLREQGLIAGLEQAAAQRDRTLVDHERSIVKTYALTWTLLQQEADNGLTQRLLGAAAGFAPDVPIERALLDRVLGRWLGAAIAPEARDLALDRLLSLALLAPVPRDAGHDGTEVRIHALVAEYTRWQLGEPAAGALAGEGAARQAAILATFNALFPANPVDLWKVLAAAAAPGWEALTAERLLHAEHAATRPQPESLAQARLAVSLGDVYQERGLLDPARSSFSLAQRIDVALLGQSPADQAIERHLSVCLERLGNVRVAQGELAAARDAYEKSLVIGERLAQQDPSSATAQRDLSISYDNVGDVRMAQGERDAARDAYEKSLAIGERLAQQDPSSATAQRDLSVSYNKVGDVRLAQGERDAARAAYEKSLAIDERLAQQDPSSATAQTDLVVSCSKLAGIERGAHAVAYLRRGQAILLRLQQEGRLTAAQQGWIAYFEAQLATRTPEP